MTSEREAYVYVQLPGTLDTVPAALLKGMRSINPIHPIDPSMAHTISA